MHDSADRLDFAPPPEPAAIRAFALAIVAHVLLMIALTWGINWNRDAENVAAEAELWSSVPQQAAPRVVTAPPLPAPPPPKPEPKPLPVPKVEPPPAPPVSKAPDIALEREKKRRELAERRQEELEREKKLEAARKKQEELKRQEEIAEQKAEEEKKKKKAEELAKAKEKQEAAKAKQDEAKLAALRKENMDRMMKGAAGTGSPSATGTAARSSGPSDSYAGRIRARVKPNIVFSDDIAGNPTAEVEVRLAPDGTITGKRVVKSSGAKSWDEAVLRALDKTEILPRDVDGRVHSPLIIEFRPKG